MELYKFEVAKNGRSYTNLVLVWSYQGKVWRLMMRPSFFKDYKVAISRAVKVNSLEECE